MSIIVESNDYSAQYNAALLEDTFPATTLKSKTTLLVFAAVLLVISALGLHVKEIPGLAIDAATSPELVKGMLSLATVYLLIQFLLCFFQDYYRWRLKMAIKTVEQFTKLLRHTSGAVDHVLRTPILSSEETVAFRSEFDNLKMHLLHANSEVRDIAFSNKVLSPAQWLRIWILDLTIPTLLASGALCLSWRSARFVLISIFQAIF